MPRKWRLWGEFLAMFVAGPTVLALQLGSQALLPALWVWTFIGLVLLHFTQGFEWRQLRGTWPSDGLARTALMGAAVLVMSLGFTYFLLPDRLFDLPLERPRVWLAIILLYPLLSAMPQELVFRVLYFERYRDILPKWGFMTLNAALFSYAHLIYGSITVFIMTFLGGMLFARAYLRGEFLLAFALHAIAGIAIFSSGLGWLFYAGRGA